MYPNEKDYINDCPYNDCIDLKSENSLRNAWLEGYRYAHSNLVHTKDAYDKKVYNNQEKNTQMDLFEAEWVLTVLK